MNSRLIGNVKTNYTERFSALWRAWPSGKKGSMHRAYTTWLSQRLETAEHDFLELVELFKKSEQWRKGYVPHVSTWLNDRPWLGCDVLDMAAHRERIATERQDAAVNPLVEKLARDKAIQDEWEDLNAAWATLADADKRKVITDLSARLKTPVSEKVARAMWWRERQGAAQ